MLKLESMKKKMYTLSTLPSELSEEILSKVPMTSLRKVRSTCKTWNTLTKDVSFSKKHLGNEQKEFLLVMMMEFKVYLMKVVNIDNNNVKSYCVMFQGEVNSLDDVHHVFHCDGLLLCVMKDKFRIMVWNPYTCQTRWIEPVDSVNKAQVYKYALGYEKSPESCIRSYKILRFIDFGSPGLVDYQLYYLNSDSWKVLDITSNGNIDTPTYNRGVSLDGNTYWFAINVTLHNKRGFLLCFDFTKERFARLHLPFQCIRKDTVTLSSVREEQLAVLFQREDTLNVEIWVTTKITPNAVSWSNKVFLALNMTPYNDFQLSVTGASFFIDEEKKVAVIFDQHTYINSDYENYIRIHNVAYIVGRDGHVDVADLEESAYQHCYPLVCSYVPSLVQLS